MSPHHKRTLMSSAAFDALDALNARIGVRFVVTLDARIAALDGQAKKLHEEMEAIVALADNEDRQLKPEELKKVKDLQKQRDALDEEILAREALKPVSAGRRTREDRTTGTNRVPAEPKKDEGKGGFKSFGEFAREARNAMLDPGNMDPRIRAAAPTTSGTEGVGADGGFAVPADFRQEIWIKVMGEENLVSRCDQLITSGNSITLPADETTPWESSGGIQAYWDSELGVMTQGKPSLQMKNIRLNKLTALVPISEELLEDAPALDGYLRTKAPSKMRAKVNTAIVRGTGAGQPMGILNSPSLITAAKASIGSPVQGATTFIYENVQDMWARLYSECRKNAVWLINQDVEPQLNTMRFAKNATQPVPAYMPAGAASVHPYATLMGRPVIPMMPCSTLGTVGDVILVDLSHYMTVTKGQDIRTDVSMHLYFDAAALAYRFIMRIAGQPWWGKVITPENGNNTLSWAVALSSTRT